MTTIIQSDIGGSYITITEANGSYRVYEHFSNEVYWDFVTNSREVALQSYRDRIDQYFQANQ